MHSSSPTSIACTSNILQLCPSTKVVGSYFPIEVIMMVMEFVFEAASSLRSAASGSAIAAKLLGFNGDAELSHTTVQNMGLRIGLHELCRPKEKADDWIWLIDHYICASTTKCFVVMGIRYDAYHQINRPLVHHDLQALALIPVETSTGLVVAQQLTALCKVTGVPRAILSDRGSDLKKGVELLRQIHPSVIPLYDILHTVSGFIAQLLESNERWPTYRQECCKCANLVRQSNMAHLKPPKPKSKAREMNLEEEVRWGARTLNLLKQSRRGELPHAQSIYLPLEQLEQRFGWLDGYETELAQWESAMQIGKTVCSLVRQYGYGATLMSRLGATLRQGNSAVETDLISKIETFCAECSGKIVDGTSLPGSTEVLESLIGKGKRMTGFRMNNSITSHVLAIAASVVTLTAAKVTDSLKACRIKHVQDWCGKHLPESLKAKRIRDLRPTEAEEKQRKPQVTTTPNF